MQLHLEAKVKRVPFLGGLICPMSSSIAECVRLQRVELNSRRRMKILYRAAAPQFEPLHEVQRQI
jgi:hypothetical protein